MAADGERAKNSETLLEKGEGREPQKREASKLNEIDASDDSASDDNLDNQHLMSKIYLQKQRSIEKQMR